MCYVRVLMRVIPVLLCYCCINIVLYGGIVLLLWYYRDMRVLWMLSLCYYRVIMVVEC